MLPSKHPFEDDGTGSCRECGMQVLFGALHPVELLEVPDPPRPEGCPDCPHYAHAGACDGAIPAGSRNLPCECREAS